MENVIALVMAAGTDDRMVSKKSKLAQPIYGKEVIKRVVEAIKKSGYRGSVRNSWRKQGRNRNYT